MNTLVGRALETYTRLDVETGVAAASPQRLVVMLYDGAIKALVSAKAALGQGDVPARGAGISKAISIVDQGLRPALDMNAGGDIAANLMALYDYIVNRLLYANLKGHEPSIDEVLHLLEELRGAWEALERDSRPGGGEQPQSQEPDQRAALSYGRV
jgi:flagellar protein FliS